MKINWATAILGGLFTALFLLIFLYLIENFNLSYFKNSSTTTDYDELYVDDIDEIESSAVFEIKQLTDEKSINEGRNTYLTNCVACHTPDGGGSIGPNLTDQYWILGGSFDDIYKTISEGGRPYKGMIAWKIQLSPVQISQVASFILSLQDTTPEYSKEPEGEIYIQNN